MSLDEKYDTLCTLIQERADFKSLTPSQALGKLNAHEMILEEKKELHSSRSTPRRSIALKAKKVDSSLDEESSGEADDEGSLGKDMALLVRRFNRFQRGSRSKKYELRKGGSSSRDPKEKNCYKCGEPDHFIAKCPLLKKEERRGRRHKVDKEEKKEKSYKKEHHSKPKHYKKNKYKAKAYLGKEWDSNASDSSSSESTSSDSETGMAGLAYATSIKARSIFDTPSDNESPTCLMAKGSKVTSKPPTYDDSDDDLMSDELEDIKSSYRKLAKILKQQETILENQEDMLVDEMEKNKELTRELNKLKSKYLNITESHETLVEDHEKINLEFLKKKQDLESLKVVHEELKFENDSLITKKISENQEGFEPPCLKCIASSNAMSSSII